MKEALRLNNNQVDAVIAANDEIAAGVVNALASVNLDGTVPVSGQDGGLEAVRRVAKGTQTMTIFKSAEIIANQAADLAVKMAKGEEIGTETTVNNGKIDVPAILLEPVVVTKENIRETIIAEGYLTEEQVYGK